MAHVFIHSTYTLWVPTITVLGMVRELLCIYREWCPLKDRKSLEYKIFVFPLSLEFYIFFRFI